MDLGNFFDTGRQKATFKVTLREGNKILKFFVTAYDKKEAETEAQEKIKKEYPEISCKKITIE